jgi:hypothetical protein
MTLDIICANCKDWEKWDYCGIDDLLTWMPINDK